MKDNPHKVPKRTWKRWSADRRLKFNQLYELMMSDQEMFLHPTTIPQPEEHWKITAWNAAWIAGEGL